MLVKQQLAIALYRFGHYGNTASTMKVALWAGVGFGTVPLVTKHPASSGAVSEVKL